MASSNRTTPNRYAGDCARCGSRVPASKFDLDGACSDQRGGVFRKPGERWQVICLACLAATPAPLADRKPTLTPILTRLADVEPTPAAAPKPAAEPRVNIFAHGDTLIVKPAAWLGDTHWAALKVACANAGADYEVEAEGIPYRYFWAAPKGSAVALLRALQAASLKVEVDPALLATLQAVARAARETETAADARTAALRDALAKRGQAFWGRFQEHGVSFLFGRPAALLADDPGLGKSMTALLALPERAAVVLVCPAIARTNWAREGLLWRPDLGLTIVRGTATSNAGLTAWPAPGQITVIGYRSLHPEPPAGTPAPGTVLICDEAHNLKGGKDTQQGACFHAHAEVVRAAGGWTWLLTGSPMVNDEDDLWEVLQLAGLGEAIFGSKRKFRRLLRDQPDDYRRSLRQGMLRRTKEEVAPELPRKVYIQHEAEITGEDRRELDHLLEQIVEAAVAKAIKDADTADEAELRQVAARTRANVSAAIEMAFDGQLQVPFEFISRVKAVTALAKTRATLALLDELESESPDPIILFSAHLSPVHAAGERPGWLHITGATTTANRQQAIDDFQAGKLRGLALVIRTAGVAINLTRATREVFNDYEWTWEANRQAIDRAHRIGSAPGTLWIHRLEADHVLDRRIMELVEQKRLAYEASVNVAQSAADERPDSRAAELEAVLRGAVTVAPAAPTTPSLVPRGPRTPEEHAAAERLGKPTPGFAVSLARQLAGGGLTDRQWAFAVRWAQENPTITTTEPKGEQHA